MTEVSGKLVVGWAAVGGMLKEALCGSSVGGKGVVGVGMRHLKSWAHLRWATEAVGHEGWCPGEGWARGRRANEAYSVVWLLREGHA